MLDISLQELNELTLAQTGTGEGVNEMVAKVLAISSAQLLALPTAVTVLAAPGTGTAYYLQGIFWEYKFVTTAYTIANADNRLQLKYTTGPTTIVSAVQTPTGLVDQTASQVVAQTIGTGGIIALSNVTNSAVLLTLTGTTPALTLGDGTLNLTLFYNIITLV